MDSIITRSLLESNAYKQLSAEESREKTVAVKGVTEESLAHLAHTLNKDKKRQIMILTKDDYRAKKLSESVAFYDMENVEYYPKKELMFYDIDAYSHEITNERFRIMSRIINSENIIVVCSVHSLFERVLTKERFSSLTTTIEYGLSYDLEKIINSLTVQGYERVDLVEAKGQFSLRGGILDIFSPNSLDPYRIEFFGDEVDSIRKFDIKTQRSLENLKKVDISVTVENIVLDEEVDSVVEKLKKDLKKTVSSLKDKKDLKETLEKIESKFNSQINKLTEKLSFKNRDFLIPYATDNLESILDYFNSDSIVIMEEPSRVEESIEEFLMEFKTRITELIERGEVVITHQETYYSKRELLDKLSTKKLILSSDISKREKTFKSEVAINFNTRSVPNYLGKMELLLADLNYYKNKKRKVVIFSGESDRGERLAKELSENQINAFYSEIENISLLDGQVAILPNSIYKGFEYTDSGWVFMGYGEVFQPEKKKKKKFKRKDAAKIRAFTDLNVGDYVVHESHGIGKYIGIKQLNIQNIKKDYMIIKYSGDDTLYIPIDQMNLIQKYIGSDSVSPKVNKLGSSDWQKTKAKVKKAIEDMAKDLIKLYATRETASGYAFSKDTPWQKQFEDAFPYEETDDQLKSIKEIKADMERPKPMDRLLCGDVGYGKTEVAIRAMFKAVMDSKQVVFLVPTTILAQQHYSNIAERFANYPIKVESLSRFKTPKQEQKILNDLKSGNIDILIATHKVLSKKAKFSDLGLLVIDEEQRFGVKQKETLKTIKESVDVLTLTATPIPRTLHMSLTGIRDMSVIEEPPKERYPVQTYVVEYNEQMIRDAIMKEMSRNGQVYLLYNKVRTIDAFAAKIKKIVPEARIAVAHGQMGERSLEKIMLDFLEQEYDVLICTTIIETGLDIPNVNTIMINDSDKMGLSQLYQLRGRVGRSNKIAYAYFMHEKNKVLSEIAEKRLKTIKEFTEFGSGFKVAMRDLEIRGAGNLLGAEQHGQMASIGYDLYVKYLDSAVKRLKGKTKEVETLETSIELNVDGYIPSSYIKREEQKIEIYKRISAIEDKTEADDLLDELVDRFGDVPVQVENLVKISFIKISANKLNISSIEQTSDKIKFSFVALENLNKELIERLIENFGNSIEIDATSTPAVKYKFKSSIQKELLREIEEVISKMAGI